MYAFTVDIMQLKTFFWKLVLKGLKAYCSVNSQTEGRKPCKIVRHSADIGFLKGRGEVDTSED